MYLASADDRLDKFPCPLGSVHFVDQAEPFASYDVVTLRRQHALTPHRSFHARPISAACLCACVVLLDTGGALLSLCLSVEFTYPPSCLPSLGAALLSALLAAFLRCGTMKALTPAPVHPKCRSPRLLRYTFLSFRLQPRRGCLIIAYHHASVTSEFRTSP
jgi:hypothetical protein